jgi:hypothetical protein
MTETAGQGPEIKSGDYVVNIRLHARNRGPFQVAKIDAGLLMVKRRAKHPLYLHPKDVIKLKPGQNIKQALINAIPANQLCEVCGCQPAPERHFLTIPLPKGFTRICVEDFVEIKNEIRQRVKNVVAAVIQETKEKSQ